MSNENIEIQEYDLEAIEQYNFLMDEFKECFKNEIINLVKECKAEIEQTRECIKIVKKENQEIFQDNQIMARQLYVNEQLLNITSETKKEKLKSLLLQTDNDMRYLNVADIDNLFEVILGEAENNG